MIPLRPIHVAGEEMRKEEMSVELDQVFAPVPWYQELLSIRKKGQHVGRMLESLNELNIVPSVDECSAMGYVVDFVYGLLISYHALRQDHFPEWLEFLGKCKEVSKQFPDEFKGVFLSAVSFLFNDHFEFELDPPDYTDSPFFFELIEKLDIIMTMLHCGGLIRDNLCPDLVEISMGHVNRVVELAARIDLDQFLAAWGKLSPNTMDPDVQELYEGRSAKKF